MLEDELTSILADQDIKQLIIVDSTEQQELARKLRSQNRPFLVADFGRAATLAAKSRQIAHTGEHSTHRRGFFKQLLHQRSVDDLIVVVNVLRLGLHVDSKLLKQDVYHQIERMANFSDGIFVLYGICDALRTLEQDFNGSACPLFFLADDGKTVDDCIALALGGNQPYGDVLTNDRDIVLFFTPMWAAHWQDLPDDYSLLKHVRFKKIAKVDTGLSYEPDFEANVDKCARRFHLRPVPLKGSTAVIHQSYQRAKNEVRRNKKDSYKQ
ncbi:MAG: DUF1638 domain-containing protein [Halobacteriota archaeon]